MNIFKSFQKLKFYNDGQLLFGILLYHDVLRSNLDVILSISIEYEQIEVKYKYLFKLYNISNPYFHRKKTNNCDVNK